MNEALVRVEHLTKYYGAKKALNDVNLNIESGRIIGLLGPNGSGKTTMMKCILGFLPHKGKITLEFYSADDREALMAALLKMDKPWK